MADTGRSGAPSIEREIEAETALGEAAEIAVLATRLAALDLNDFHLGVVNAIPREKAALKKVFGTLERIPQDPGSLSMDYAVIKKADNTDALVAVAGVAGMGIAQAAVATASLKQWLPTMSRVILVGIAAGQPKLDDEERDVRVGDVVVSDGVVQYDHVKRVSAGDIEYRGKALDGPDPRLLAAVMDLKSEMEDDGPWAWEAPIARAVNAWPKAERPEYELDSNRASRTYKCGFHRHGDERPHLHVGVVGSANMLLKDSAYRDTVHKAHGTIAYEMEGAGVAIAARSLGLGYLLVRGICDYADEKKNDDWQRYAAVAAAAVAWAIIVHT